MVEQSAQEELLHSVLGGIQFRWSRHPTEQGRPPTSETDCGEKTVAPPPQIRPVDHDRGQSPQLGRLADGAQSASGGSHRHGVKAGVGQEAKEPFLSWTLRKI